MSDVELKIRRGFALVDRATAGDDSDLAGVALLAFHGAMEDHLRGELKWQILDLSDEHRAMLEQRDLGFPTLVGLAQRHLGYDADLREDLLRANNVRRIFAHGGICFWGGEQVLRFGRLVARLCAYEQGQAGLDANRAGLASHGGTASFELDQPPGGRSGERPQPVSRDELLERLLLGEIRTHQPGA